MKNFWNIKRSNDFQIKNDVIIIPLHSPNDSFEELIIGDLDSNITKAVVHVSYKPKQVESETEISNKLSNDMVINQSITFNESQNKEVNIINNTEKNAKVTKEHIESSSESSYKISNNLIKFEETSKSSLLNR